MGKASHHNDLPEVLRDALSESPQVAPLPKSAPAQPAANDEFGHDAQQARSRARAKSKFTFKQKLVV